MSEKFKPCPFCGGAMMEFSDHKYDYVFHINRGCILDMFAFQVEAWDARFEDEEDSIAKEGTPSHSAEEVDGE